tara:strand:- start:138 stop:473 length:336 start_codon:yes stop_codon:yes gene_type:complete
MTDTEDLLEVGRRYERLETSLSITTSKVHNGNFSGFTNGADNKKGEETNYMLITEQLRNLQKLKSKYYPRGNEHTDAVCESGRLALKALEDRLGQETVERLKANLSELRGE